MANPYVQNVNFLAADPGQQIEQQIKLQRAAQLAEMLQQQSQEPIQSAGPMSPISWTNSLAKIAQSIAGAKQQTNAMELAKQLGTSQAQNTQGLLQALQGTQQPGTDPSVKNNVMPPQGIALPPDQQPQLRPDQINPGSPATNSGPSPQALAAALANPQLHEYAKSIMDQQAKRNETSWQDVGGQRVLVDNNGNRISSLDKSLSPDTTYTGGITMRGQDMTQGTAIRGQDLGAATTRRGQDIGAATAVRGQDLGAETTRRGQDLEQFRFNVGAGKMTEADKRNAVLYNSMLDSENTLAKLTGADTSNMGQAALGTSAFGRALQSDDYKKYEAAGLRWTANNLYLKSGANAPDEEVRKAWVQYFPQPGDGPEVIAQKNAARRNELMAIHNTMAPTAATVNPAARRVVKTGTHDGKKVVQYEDGSVEYAP